MLSLWLENSAYIGIWAIDCAFHQPAASKAATGGQLTRYLCRVMSPFSVMLCKNVVTDPSWRDEICVFIQPGRGTESLACMPMAIVDQTAAPAT